MLLIVVANHKFFELVVDQENMRQSCVYGLKSGRGLSPIKCCWKPINYSIFHTILYTLCLLFANCQYLVIQFVVHAYLPYFYYYRSQPKQVLLEAMELVDLKEVLELVLEKEELEKVEEQQQQQFVGPLIVRAFLWSLFCKTFHKLI